MKYTKGYVLEWEGPTYAAQYNSELEQKLLETVCNVNIRNLKSENSHCSLLCPQTSMKLYVHDFGSVLDPSRVYTVQSVL
jgi:hypothetical protein